MDFFSSIIAVALSYGFTETQVVEIHSNYCENLYWQPNSVQKMEEYGCDIDAVAKQIQTVQEGRY